MPTSARKWKALEFFSGIGAFTEATRTFDLEVIAAFDQNDAANLAYQSNFGLRPSVRNLDTIKAEEIPSADIWWMSPPCKPFTVRGKRRDAADPRAAAFLNLIKILDSHRPQYLLLENVNGFPGSQVHTHLLDVLGKNRYSVSECSLCPTMFGVRMRRPRHFVIASRALPGSPTGEQTLKISQPPECKTTLLADFIDSSLFDQNLFLPEAIMSRYCQGFDIVDVSQPEAYLTCFTSGYYRCRKASGSLVQTTDGRARLVSPKEILRLLGFANQYVLPAEIDLPAQWRLVGNSVDVRSIQYLLGQLFHIMPDGRSL